MSQPVDPPITTLEELADLLCQLEQQGYIGYEFDDVAECMRVRVIERRRDVAV